MLDCYILIVSYIVVVLELYSPLVFVFFSFVVNRKFSVNILVDQKNKYKTKEQENTVCSHFVLSYHFILSAWFSLGLRKQIWNY